MGAGEREASHLSQAGAAWIAAAILLAGVPSSARSEIGWTPEEYERVYGPGQKSMGQAPEVGYQVGHSRLVVEFRDGRSVAELWALGTQRDQVPETVIRAGHIAAQGKLVKRVLFRARDAIPAEIRQAVVGDVVVWADIRNRYLNRVAFCAKKRRCGWWAWLWRRCDEAALLPACGVLDRALEVDKKIDELHVKAEAALNRRPAIQSR